MHVYCVHRGVKRHDIVKENLTFALQSLESEIYFENGAKFPKFKFNVLFVDRLKVQFFVKKKPSLFKKKCILNSFSKIYKLIAILTLYLT